MTKSLLLLPLILMLSACAGFNQPPTILIVTEGFQTEKPAKGTRAMFPDLYRAERFSFDYAGNQIVRQAVMDWLRHVGIVFVGPAEHRSALLDEQRFRLRNEDADRMRVGRLHGASLFVDVRITEVSYMAPAVSITAMSVETGEVVWVGSAKWPDHINRDAWARNDHGALVFLIDKALATAFGFISPGVHRIPIKQP